jgi:hypothetical protein
MINWAGIRRKTGCCLAVRARVGNLSTGTLDSSRNPAFIFSDARLHSQFRFECERSSASCPVARFNLPHATVCLATKVYKV